MMNRRNLLTAAIALPLAVPAMWLQQRLTGKARPPLARRLARPVTWTATRSEDIQSTVHGRGQVQRVALAMDDDGRFRALEVDLLADMGAAVLDARDGQEAVELAATNDIDMAFLDIHMPHMNGLDAARHIRTM